MSTSRAPPGNGTAKTSVACRASTPRAPRSPAISRSSPKNCRGEQGRDADGVAVGGGHQVAAFPMDPDYLGKQFARHHRLVADGEQHRAHVRGHGIDRLDRRPDRRSHPRRPVEVLDHPGAGSHRLVPKGIRCGTEDDQDRAAVRRTRRGDRKREQGPPSKPDELLGLPEPPRGAGGEDHDGDRGVQAFRIGSHPGRLPGKDSVRLGDPEFRRDRRLRRIVMAPSASVHRPDRRSACPGGRAR